MEKPPYCPLSTSSTASLSLFSFPTFPRFSQTSLPPPALYQAGSSRATPGSNDGSVGLAWEKILGGLRELEVGGCKGTAAGAAWPWKSIGNVIVNVGVKQAQTQEAKRVHGGMQRDGACDCTALIDLFFYSVGKGDSWESVIHDPGALLMPL